MCLSFRTLAAVCSVAVSLNTGCAANNGYTSPDSSTSSPLLSPDKDIASEPVIVPEIPEASHFEAATDATRTITFSEDSIGVRGDGIEVEGNSAVITEGGAYRLSGESSNGRIIVRSSENVSLILDGLDIRAENGVVLESDGGLQCLTLTLAEGKENRISCEGERACGISGSSDITINGSGSLAINGSDDAAINSGGAVRLCGGDISISSDGDGIVSGSHIIAAGSETTISSRADGLKVTHTATEDLGYVSITGGVLDIVSGTDGIQAENAVFVSGGIVSLDTGGGSSAVMYNDHGGRYLRGKHGGYTAGGDKDFDFSDLVSGDGSSVSSKKGIRSGGTVTISGGVAEISSADDSIYARSGIYLDAGRLALSSGDDGLHSDRGIIISGGELSVEESYNSVEGMMVEIRGGEVKLNARRGGIVSAGGTQLASSAATDLTDRYVSVSGGNVSLSAGGSGINSGGAATVSGGRLTVFSGDNDMFGSVDHRDYFALSGGAFAAFGSDGATKAPNVLSRPCISILADIAANSAVEIMNSAGECVFSALVPCASSTILFSSDDIVSGEEYSVYADGTLKKTIIVTEGICGDGPSGRVTGIFDDLGGSMAGQDENIA